MENPGSISLLMPSNHISNDDYHEWLNKRRSAADAKLQNSNNSTRRKSGRRKRNRLRRGSVVSDSVKLPANKQPTQG